MTFFERYASIVEQRHLDPCSQKAADLLGVTKATISVWNIKGTTPKGETVAVIADKLGVSADYLLGRTDNPIDFTKSLTTDRKPTDQSFELDDTFLLLYSRLDETDKAKVEGVIQGMLMQEKYIDAMPNAAHARTDVSATPDMIAHDNSVMDDDDF